MSTPTKYEGHTPGPWHVSLNATQDLVCAGDEVIADCTTGDLPDISQANARLIADAPALLAENTRLREALQRCVSYLADLNGSSWILGDGVGEIDMRQRARELQQHVWSTLLPKQALAAGKGEMK